MTFSATEKANSVIMFFEVEEGKSYDCCYFVKWEWWFCGSGVNYNLLLHRKTRWTWAVFLFRCFLACILFFLVKSNAPKGGWLLAFWEMKPKWNSNVDLIQMCMGFCYVSHLWLNGCPSIFKVWKFYYLFLFALLNSGGFGEFVLFLMNYLDFIFIFEPFRIKII